MAKIHGFKEPSFYVGRQVDVELHSMTTTEDVFWSHRSNSYVLAEAPVLERKEHVEQVLWTEEGKAVQLLSVNGIGEVRWPVWPYHLEAGQRAEKAGWIKPDHDIYEYLQAARHFGLSTCELKTHEV